MHTFTCLVSIICIQPVSHSFQLSIILIYFYLHVYIIDLLKQKILNTEVSYFPEKDYTSSYCPFFPTSCLYNFP